MECCNEKMQEIAREEEGGIVYVTYECEVCGDIKTVKETKDPVYEW